MSAIGELITETLKRTGMKPSHFVAALGDRNLGKGVKRLHEFLHTGVPVPQAFVERLPDALGVDPTMVAAGVHFITSSGGGPAVIR